MYIIYRIGSRCVDVCSILFIIYISICKTYCLDNPICTSSVYSTISNVYPNISRVNLGQTWKVLQGGVDVTTRGCAENEHAHLRQPRHLEHLLRT
jgi:hypothetical protein